MSKTYGNTWWGSKWLDAFKDIDFSNRLTRGRSHADKGAVLQISIDNNFVQATVAGNQTQPYQVELRFSKFNKNQDILRFLSISN